MTKRKSAKKTRKGNIGEVLLVQKQQEIPKRKRKGQIGRTVQTRDEFFEGKADYRKPGYERRGYYRKAVVVAEYKNRYALVKLTTSEKGTDLIDEKKSKYRPYVEVRDDEGKPITFNRKFIPNSKQKRLSHDDTEKIQRDCFAGNSDRSFQNRNKVREMKGKKPLQKRKVRLQRSRTGQHK